MRTTDMHDVHEGRNVKRLREILGIKQDALAIDLGITQQAVSLLEQKETIDAPVLEKIAKSLGVSVDAIRNYDETAAYNFISNTFNEQVNMNYQCTFNPLEQLIAAMTENRRLQEENKMLYSQLLQSEKDKVEMLQSTLRDIKGLMNK